MSKRICLVGGEDVHKRIALSSYLEKEGFQVTILGTSTVKFPDSIEYVPYNLVRHFSPISDLKTIDFFKKYFAKNSFDVIHTFDTKPAFLVPLALKNTNTPITRTITGLGTIFMASSIYYTILRKSYYLLHKSVKNRVYKTIFQNYDDRDIYKSHDLISDENHELIFSSGIELKYYPEIAKRNNKIFTFICVARLVYEKGIINLLEAARICEKEGHHFKILLVGPLEENSKRLNQGILDQYKDIVDILGSRRDVYELLLASDAFVLPTFREGFARVLMEAAAVGLPIIATDTTGVKEFCRHEKEALLVPLKNSLELAKAMIRLAENRDLANELAENALKHVERFSLENVSKQYINIFNKAINHKTLEDENSIFTSLH
ncbi:glycosyltransferase involved in cell wall biosynthesis [Oceanihabitans sediminis]|uniref:Glycosyltransferase family 1 protein n=1 Tax=Oceanihabitans sediminis TaxID=1812012 RepID=A0A368P5T1_9FLAO|nr:glycosyltransferase [Oceanihabitans sediminis]RBP33050.1 glycosyltransferase involved in cell wall biosynthesis [Oceanihabitans sediminis]RCU57434.1 glycosyltransferase family 1 protein [Oceanihabitans sediminis]